MTPTNGQSELLTFQVKPRLLTLLGDQLIRDATLAVYELVKNAYDADATECSVRIENPAHPEKARILIRDNGSGMDAHVLRDSWMVIGTDFRAKQREAKQRSPTYHRFPLGEKGLGRLSIHKLGRSIQLVTRMPRGEELVMDFNWDVLESSTALNITPVALASRTPRSFPGNKHGTELIITRLRESWTRGDLRKLHRAIAGLCSPFKSPDNFTVSLFAPGSEQWLDGLLGANDVKHCALYHAHGHFSGQSATFSYRFTPPSSLARQIEPRFNNRITVALEAREGRKSLPLNLDGHDIGEVEFDFLLFDLDPRLIRLVTDDVSGLKGYLNDNGGVRVYRDGIRVYDFGEPGNDWLNLDLRRVNTPTARTSNNQILGALRLDATLSAGLREKSNREGFIDSPAYQAFIAAVISVLTQVEAERSKDQRRLRESLGKGDRKTVFARLADLRDLLDQKGVLKDVEPRLIEVEKEMEVYRDQLLHAAVPGLTLGLMIHGAEKILDELRLAASGPTDTKRIKALVDQLYRAMRPVTNLLKNPGKAKTTAFKLIDEAVFSTELRLRRHGVTLIKGKETGNVDFPVEGSKQMLIASITNLIDNAIHWLEIKASKQKTLYLGTSNELHGGASIIVADNGPGFGDDSPSDLVEPFFTRRPGGMGLGLYIVNEVMRVHGGLLAFPGNHDIELPNACTGAVVAMHFKEQP
ncbi:sensor histidine kinase [Planctopirus hydrillae]|uniref:histidine kinase n=1 Tax=Planctopirus hydrillae TaxID=1841610 RepID=A0A1C3ETG6_9PLAN|nr:sensor histidine kinase [Planctopirus hydrillae]ODA36494.1 hypothetical protein A6X21_02080 [Planctopirus hydrillae]